jgi:serine/threonine-protein kinase
MRREQVTGEPVSAATDVYALGVLMYAPAVNRHPAGETIRSPGHMVSLIVEREAPESVGGRHHGRRERERCSDCHYVLDHAGAPETPAAGRPGTIVRKAMRQRPTDRYASVDALARTCAGVAA